MCRTENWSSIRRRVVCGSPADARDRHACGAGRTPQGNRVADYATRSGNRGSRLGDWLRGGTHRHRFCIGLRWRTQRRLVLRRGADGNHDSSMLPARAASRRPSKRENSVGTVVWRGLLRMNPIRQVCFQLAVSTGEGSFVVASSVAAGAAAGGSVGCGGVLSFRFCRRMEIKACRAWRRTFCS